MACETKKTTPEERGWSAGRWAKHFWAAWFVRRPGIVQVTVSPKAAYRQSRGSPSLVAWQPLASRRSCHMSCRRVLLKTHWHCFCNRFCTLVAPSTTVLEEPFCVSSPDLFLNTARELGLVKDRAFHVGDSAVCGGVLIYTCCSRMHYLRLPSYIVLSSACRIRRVRSPYN